MKGGIEVEVVGTTVVRLVATPPIAAKILPGPVLLLVGSAAGLLAGDEVHVRIDLAPGACLTVRTTAATIAHPCVDGGGTSFDVDAVLGAGARLVWLPEPTIACAGCRHEGRAQLTLAPGATTVWLDAVALGRSGEQPGSFSQRLDAEIDGRPLLREALRVGPGAAGWDGPAVLGPNRHVAALHSLGRRVVLDHPGVMQLAGLGTTARFVARRASDLTRQVTSILPLFDSLYPDPPASAFARETSSPKETLHV